MIAIIDDRSLPLFSPELTSLPLPRTPANRSGSQERDTSVIAPSSEYYTAAWGSPYDSPSNISRSVRTAISERPGSDDYLSSPESRFGLEHLIPSRFGELRLPDSDFNNADDYNDAFISLPTVHTSELTPRPSTNRWISLPRRQAPERPQWWTEGAGDSGSEREVAQSLGSPQEPAFLRGHKAREENRTLDQQTFWNTVREGQDETMTSLLSSRWATAPAEEQPGATDEAVLSADAAISPKDAVEETNDNSEDVATIKEAADEVDVEGPLPKVAPDTSQVQKEDTLERAVSTTDVEVVPAEEKTFPNEQGEGEPKATATPVIEVAEEILPPKPVSPTKTATSTDALRLEPPRLKKHISFRGKKCVINIPNLDYAAHGLPLPMSIEEVRARIQSFEDRGYSTSAFDDTEDSQMHNKPIYPAEVNDHDRRENYRPVVHLPDLNAWKNYMQAVMEAKLAALGVSMGDEVPTPAQDMSRQPSGAFMQPFSPPIPTGSAMSMGRPPFVRGHSHTMSVAPPISPMNNPFGHMHRHSTFSLSPMQAQELARQAAFSGLQSFSPQPQLPQIGSPAQLNAMRNDLGVFRGPGSPLTQSMTPDPSQEYNRLRQAGYIPQPPASFTPQRNPEPIPVLPELPEDEDEDELSDAEPYVPPHKRAHINEEIAVPTPRGHRHNISESLEREVMQTEHHNGLSDVKKTRTNGFGQAPQLFGQVSDQVPLEKDPLGGDFSVAQSNHSHKKSASRLNVAAPVFTFNPAATFQPGSSAFSFPPPVEQPIVAKHTRQTSSGNFNAAAVEFKPSGSFKFTAPVIEEKPAAAPAVPSSGFNFSASGPKFSADAPEFKPPVVPNIVDALPSIFGKIDIPDIVKPAKKSKAISIVHPSDSSKSASATDVEDAEGRLGRSDERLKRTRVGGGDGDEVPRFAEPSHAPFLPSQPADQFPVVEESIPEPIEEENAVDREVVLEPSPKHQLRPSLSALAKPWQPSASNVEQTQEPATSPSISSLEDGEVAEVQANDLGTNGFAFPQVPSHQAMPSFDEIDAVMAQLNADEPAKEQERVPSPKREDSYEPQEGVTYIPAWPRSDAPSPSPKRKLARSPPPFDAQQGLPHEVNGWPHINRLNKAEGPPSDWSDMLSPTEDYKLQARSSFFDDRVDDVIGRVLGDRLRPFEEALHKIQLSLNTRSPSHARPLSKHRSSSNIDSDADDEDDSDIQLQRPISRGRDQKLGQFKAVVVEALREQSPQRQTSYNIADLHSALADMKVSFARVASTSLELDDIRAIVEDVVGRQSQALVTVNNDVEPSAEHQRDVAELENRLNQTLTSSLEQANRIHEVESREAEARRMLKLAEEELRLLRDTTRDDGSRVRALEEEHNRLVEQLDEAEDGRSKAEARYQGMEAEVEALSATLEEYRLSSNKWRAEADEHEVERQSLQNTVLQLERQVAETQDSGSSMRRRLEKLHSDLATAMGQLTSEKGQWTTREQTYRGQWDALQAQHASLRQEKSQLEQEVLALRAKTGELDTAKQSFEGLRANHASLDELVTGLRAELAEQRQLTARFQQESIEAKEAGRSEVQRVRSTLELDLEAANHRVNLVRAELESEVAKARAEVEHVKLEADTANKRHALLSEAAADSHREAVEKSSLTHSAALSDVHARHELAIQDLTKEHTRSLAHAVEDKERSEYILNERLALADAKLQHFQDKVLHLEERVEVAKSAAQAAVMNVQSTRSVPSPRSSLPEKVSPQALRESILVLQEQLQEREGPAKIKERDDEIAWLRELLAVRGDELAELVNTLAKPTFDRDAVRDTAIRIRANLQMEQQEKERFGQANNFSTQAIASLSSFATPKAAQLTSAFNKWRTSMESTALKSRPSSRTRSYTPSRVTSGGKPNYAVSGLMTPPASNLRSSPSPESQAPLPAPKLPSRRTSQVKPISMSEVESRSLDDSAEPSTPTLLENDHYDDDAEDRPTTVEEDEDLNVADSEPPAFRSLEDELVKPVEAGAEES
ncbi:hypothetical protein AMS68_007722 [Peltaster fructicola]|uniref:Uncharacterized protein n=1 Tax=Peltaster fructicola TaxID=286661 RepID=A0A6H0Y5N0_9PEZI|nr:hypothetical protein AMS68_007722 [Peltaster fructicola]